jgi:hypothetical protein
VGQGSPVVDIARTAEVGDDEEEKVVWVLVGVVVVLLVVVGLLVARQQRSRQLKEGFGPEYDRVVEERGDQRAGERELLERRRRHEQFEIRALDTSARAAYLERWLRTQRRFVDEPAVAVAEADVLVGHVMRDRGYPVGDDFEQRAADVSVEHPAVVENYRAAQAISERAKDGQASTEELRQSMVHFRALFDDLLDEEDGSRGNDDAGRGDISRDTTARR